MCLDYIFKVALYVFWHFVQIPIFYYFLWYDSFDIILYYKAKLFQEAMFFIIILSFIRNGAYQASSMPVLYAMTGIFTSIHTGKWKWETMLLEIIWLYQIVWKVLYVSRVTKFGFRLNFPVWLLTNKSENHDPIYRNGTY